MSKTSKKTATIEEVWSIIKASEEARLRGEEALRESYLQTQKEVQKTQKEVQKTQKEVQKTQKAVQKTQTEVQKTQTEVQKTQTEVQKTQKEVRELNESLKEANGNFNKKWGHFLENLLEGDLVKLLNGQNIKVEEVYPRVVVKRSGVIMGEYDLVAVNGEEVVVVEVKTTLEKDAVGRFLKELTNFKDRVSVYKEKTLYGAMAYMSVKENDRSKEFREYKNASEMAEKNGLFLIQSPGGAKDVSKIVNKEGFSPKVL